MLGVDAAAPRNIVAVTVFLYDGDCAFCAATVETLRRRLPRFPTALPHQEADLHGFGLTEREAADTVWLVGDGVRVAGVHAYEVLLRNQPGFGWRLAGRLLGMPPISWVAALLYRGLARIRHLLPGMPR